jgi:hypothetical protein
VRGALLGQSTGTGQSVRPPLTDRFGESGTRGRFERGKGYRDLRHLVIAEVDEQCGHMCGALCECLEHGLVAGICGLDDA